MWCRVNAAGNRIKAEAQRVLQRAGLAQLTIEVDGSVVRTGLALADSQLLHKLLSMFSTTARRLRRISRYWWRGG